MGEWQAIESVPDDGGYFLAWSHRDGMMLMRQWGANSNETWSLEGRVKGPEPTHWMPLPSPPST